MTSHRALREGGLFRIGAVILMMPILSLLVNGYVVELNSTQEERCFLEGSFLECIAENGSQANDQKVPNHATDDSTDQIVAILDAECRDMSAVYRCSEQHLSRCFKTPQRERMFHLYLTPMQRFGALCKDEIFRRDYVRNYDCIWKADQCSKEVTTKDNNDRIRHNCAELNVLSACVKGLVDNECSADGGSILERIFHTLMGPQMEVCMSMEEPQVDIHKRQEDHSIGHLRQLSRRMSRRALH